MAVATRSDEEFYCYNALLQGESENKILSDFKTLYPHSDGLKTLQTAYKAFSLIALQPEEVIVGKAIAQLDYQLEQANIEGDITASINAIKARTEIYRKFIEKKNGKEISDNRPSWL